MLPETMLPAPRRIEPPREQTAAAAHAPIWTRGEIWVVSAAVCALVALRVAYVFHYRVDSDEPQHLHVVWGWASGLIQYRDLFDNHAPLFQMLCSPLMRALGERSDIIIPMRLAMLPLFLADLWCVYTIAARLFSHRTALWCAAFCALLPTFFFVTTEFRTDDLWTTLWLAALVIATGGKFAGRRAWWFGVCIGATFAVSMKTTLMLLALALAALMVAVLRRFEKRAAAMPMPTVKACALALAGMLVVPSALVALFGAWHALPQMYYCVIQHNTVPGLGKWRKVGFHLFIFPLSILPLAAGAWLAMRSAADQAQAGGRALVLFTGGFYLALLRSYWPLVTAQDYVPFLPLFSIVAMSFVAWLGALLHPRLRYALPALLLCAELGAVLFPKKHTLAEKSVRVWNENLAEVLDLTNPGDYVMDAKGETIFRTRPIYFVLEGVTLQRMKMGLIANNIRERLLATKTCVVLNHRLREPNQSWMRANYISGNSRVFVAGKNLGEIPSAGTIDFSTVIPARYAFLFAKKTAAGTIDGQPLAASQWIEPGAHELRFEPGGSGAVALVWAQAAERGFTPFSKHAPRPRG